MSSVWYDQKISLYADQKDIVTKEYFRGQTHKVKTMDVAKTYTLGLHPRKDIVLNQ